MLAANTDMRNIFESCQHRAQTHQKHIKEMTSLYDKVGLEDFSKSFWYLLLYSLKSERNSPFSERTLDFVSKFVTSLANKPSQDDVFEEDLDPFVVFLMERVVELHDAESTDIRYNGCKLLRKILDSLSPEFTMSEELYVRVCRSMLANVQDRVAEVRIQAIHTVCRLQDPTDDHCPILKAYLFHMERDSNPSVRAAVLSCIAATSRSLAPIVKRTRDVKDIVRKAAYLFLANKVNLKTLTISQRLQLLKDGLNDRSDMVKTVVKENLLPAWIKTLPSLISFLECLDVQGDPDISQKILDIYFDEKSPREIVELLSATSKDKVIPHEQLTCELALLWRCICQYLGKQKNPIAVECLECLQPELIKFCDYMKTYILNAKHITDLVKRLEHTFISHQMLIIAKDYDLTDEAGRRCLDNLSRDLLLNPELGIPLVKPVITCYLRMHKDVEQGLQDIAEIISDIREPITLVEVQKTLEEKRQIELKIAKLKVDINELKEELETCVRNQEFQKAQDIKETLSAKEEAKEAMFRTLLPSSQEVRSEKNDPETLLKCLTLVTEMLLQADFKVITPALYTLMEALFLPGIKNEDPAVRNQAVLSLGLACLLNRNVACQHFVLFLQISQIDQVAIRATALKIIIDLLLLYGVQAFQEDDKVEDFVQVVPDTPPPHAPYRQASSQESQKAFTSLLYILKSQLDSEAQEIRSTVAEGLGKLLFNGRIYSPPLLSHLILLWYNPATENETFLRHFLGVFLPALASRSRTSQKCFEEAFMPTILTLLDAPISSPLSQVDTYNVGKFILYLTNSSACQGNETSIEETNIHERLAERICNEILKIPDSSDVRVWSQLLNCIELSTCAHPVHKDLAVLIDKCIEAVDEKQIVRKLGKFRDSINAVIARSQKNSSENSRDSLDVNGTEEPSNCNGMSDATRNTTPDRDRQIIATDSCESISKNAAVSSKKRRGRSRK